MSTKQPRNGNFFEALEKAAIRIAEETDAVLSKCGGLCGLNTITCTESCVHYTKDIFNKWVASFHSLSTQFKKCANHGALFEFGDLWIEQFQKVESIMKTATAQQYEVWLNILTPQEKKLKNKFIALHSAIKQAETKLLNANLKDPNVIPYELDMEVFVAKAKLQHFLVHDLTDIKLKAMNEKLKKHGVPLPDPIYNEKEVMEAYQRWDTDIKHDVNSWSVERTKQYWLEKRVPQLKEEMELRAKMKDRIKKEERKKLTEVDVNPALKHAFAVSEAEDSDELHQETEAVEYELEEYLKTVDLDRESLTFNSGSGTIKKKLTVKSILRRFVKKVKKPFQVRSLRRKKNKTFKQNKGETNKKLNKYLSQWKESNSPPVDLQRQRKVEPIAKEKKERATWETHTLFDWKEGAKPIMEQVREYNQQQRDNKMGITAAYEMENRLDVNAYDMKSIYDPYNDVGTNANVLNIIVWCVAIFCICGFVCGFIGGYMMNKYKKWIERYEYGENHGNDVALHLQN